MKLRNGLVFLMILALVSACLPASADNTDFPFLPGMSWSSTVKEVEGIIGSEGDESGETVGNSGRLVYFRPRDPGVAPVPYELALSLSSRGGISLVIFLYDISSAPDKNAARGQIVDEMEKLYGARGAVMFDSPETMQQAFAGKDSLQDVMMASALGGLDGAVRDMYGDLDLIVRTKAWIVDRKYAAMVAYSTAGDKSDRVAVVMVNVEETLSMMMDEELPTDRTGCFDLPAGASWACSAAELESALNRAGISYTVDGDLYQVSVMSGPEGTLMAAVFMLQEGRLMGAAYVLPLMGYDDLEQLMIREYGNKTMIDTEQIKQQNQTMMGIPATRVSVWIGTESLHYLCESSQSCFVMQLSTQMLMEQQ